MLKDFFNNDIEKGDLVSFAGTGTLHKGIVHEIKGSYLTIFNASSDTIVKRNNEVVVFPKCETKKSLHHTYCAATDENTKALKKAGLKFADKKWKQIKLEENFEYEEDILVINNEIYWTKKSIVGKNIEDYTEVNLQNGKLSKHSLY